MCIVYVSTILLKYHSRHPHLLRKQVGQRKRRYGGCGVKGPIGEGKGDVEGRSGSQGVGQGGEK